MDRAQKLARPGDRAAPGLHRADVAVKVAPPVAEQFVFWHTGPGGRERPTIVPRGLAGWAAVGVALVGVGREKVPSVRLELSNTGMCGSIARSLTSQFSISARAVAG